MGTVTCLFTRGYKGMCWGACENAKVSWWKFAAHFAPRCFQELCELSWSKRLVQKIGGKNTVSDRFLEPRIFEKPFLVMKFTDSESTVTIWKTKMEASMGM